MKLLLDDKGAVVVRDEKPVFVAEDGKEIAVDYVGTLATITRLNGEAKRHREEKEALAEKLKPFEGIEDAAKAHRALEIVKNLDDKKLIDAGEVDKIKQEAAKSYEDKLKAIEKKYEPVIGERDSFKNQLHNEILGGAFSRSKYIAEKLAVPADMIQSTFGKYFTIEEGNKVVAINSKGERIFSRARAGEIADFDEALEALVEAYPNRDSIIKGSGASGSGAGSSARTVGGKKTILRSAFEALPPAEQMATVKGGIAVVDQ
jgi:hypothetical protein